MALGVSLLIGGCSLLKPASSEERTHAYLFNKFDGNRDGVSTKAEYFDFIDERFEKMNPDDEGIVTKEGLMQTRFYKYLPALALSVFRDSDSDGNGKIPKEEMVAAESVRFAQMDKDGNGELSKAEFVVNDMREFKK